MFGEGVLVPTSKVVKYGIGEMTCRWVCDWLKKHCSIVLKFVVKIKLLKLQRSNLAPVLFNIFISNLNEGMESLLHF